MDDIQKAIQGARAAQFGRIYGNFTNNEELNSDEDKITKAQDSDKEETKEDEVEKSDMMNALDGGSIKVSKTGKEIKKQVDEVLMPEYTANLAVQKSEADTKLEDCGTAPSKDPDTWWTNGIKIDCGYKIYDWDETYIPQNSGVGAETFSANDAKDKEVNLPADQEQANARRDYNDKVREICGTLVDIKACEILKELKDGSNYELTPRQVIAFCF